MTSEPLLLRAPVPADAVPLHAVLGDPAVCRFLPVMPSPGLAATRHYLGSCALLADSEGIDTQVLVHPREPSAPFGLVQAGLRNEALEIGMLLARAWWGRGLMAQALDRLLATTPARLGAREATAACDAGNAAARRVLAKAGFAEAGVLPAFRVHPAFGTAPRDCILLRRALWAVHPVAETMGSEPRS